MFSSTPVFKKQKPSCPASITDKNKVLYLNCPQPKGLKWPGQEVQSASIAEKPSQQILRDRAQGVLRGFPDKREAAVRLWDAGDMKEAQLPAILHHS